MHPLAFPMLAYYLAVMAIFIVYGLHRYWLVVQFLRAGGRAALTGPPADDACAAETKRNPNCSDDLPCITVQLPMFNEPAVAERLIRACAAFDYPAERLQIQVLDDSTDECTAIARACCEELTRTGIDIQFIHRTNREGFKAGALANGLRTARGELIAVFDADFLPPPDLLRRAIVGFDADDVGMVQLRWDHLNRDRSWLTQILAMCLDGHFVIEQTARAKTGRWFNFNGTAGLWRHACIEEAGGWQHDTLTEDTDLSYRAQLAGWRFRYLPHVTCPAELPPTVSTMTTQQHRWNKGLVQTGIKLLPSIMRSSAPLRTKLEAAFHLTAPLPYAAVFLLTLLILPGLFLANAFDVPQMRVIIAGGVAALLFGTCAATVYFMVAQWALGRPLLPLLWRVPVLMAVNIGASLINTRAIVEAMLGVRSPFIRTPKFGRTATGRLDPTIARNALRFPRGALELTLGLALLFCIVPTLQHPFTLIGAPFLVLFASGYLIVGFPQMFSPQQRAASIA